MDLEEARQNYEAVVSLLPLLEEQQSVPQLFKVARHVFSLNAIVNHDKDSHSVWKKRVDDLHGQLVSSVGKFLQQFSQTPEEFGNACLSLLYVGAEACERIQKDKETLSTQLSIERERNAELNKRFQSEIKDSALKENLELRTRLVVQQQKVIQNEAETREVVQRLKTTLAQNNTLHREKERLADERKKNLQILERQASTISQLMDKCSNDAKEKDEALTSLKLINEDNKILTLNLDRHSKVIQDLMYVNAEMIEAANCYAKMQDADETHLKAGNNTQIDNCNGNHHGKVAFNSTNSDTVDDIYRTPSSIPDNSRKTLDILQDKVGPTSERKQKVKLKSQHSRGRRNPTFC